MASTPLIQQVPKAVEEKCLPEGRRIATFQQDISLLQWSADTFQGLSCFTAKFSFNIRSLNQQPLTALQSLILSIATVQADMVAVVDIGNNLPIYIGSSIGFSNGSLEWGVFPFITADDQVNVTLISNADLTGTGAGLFSIGVSNFEIDPIFSETLYSI